jgi:hypothetical protein
MTSNESRRRRMDDDPIVMRKGEEHEWPTKQLGIYQVSRQ